MCVGCLGISSAAGMYLSETKVPDLTELRVPPSPQTGKNETKRERNCLWQQVCGGTSAEFRLPHSQHGPRGTRGPSEGRGMGRKWFELLRSPQGSEAWTETRSSKRGGLRGKESSRLAGSGVQTRAAGNRALPSDAEATFTDLRGPTHLTPKK